MISPVTHSPETAFEAPYDPIARCVENWGAERDLRPAILVALDIAVTVRGALAQVEMTRTFENTESRPIEALLTVPVPVQAAFYGLTAKIGDRTLEAKPMVSQEARDTYEEALDEGKAAVLHEELLRGVHMLSVGNLGAGVKALITTRWAMPLQLQGDEGHLRIPLTVGDVYGISGLSDADDLVHGGKAPSAILRVRHDAEDVTLLDGTPIPVEDDSLRASIPSDAPIDILVKGWKEQALLGRSRDGRQVSMTFKPAPVGSDSLNAVVLVDHSGSMYSQCDGSGGESLSAHEAVVQALRQSREWLRNGDKLALWEFDDECDPVGSGNLVTPRTFAQLVGKLNGPSGGTEIGGALDAVQKVDSRDILLITDGMSYALDIQEQAQRNRRVFVVLVGEGSLDANVGHLAALTGGDLQFSFGSDAARALKACIQGMRTVHRTDHAYEVSPDGQPLSLVAGRGNAVVEVSWTDAEEGATGDEFSSAVAAYAASLAMARSVDDESATNIALTEGLVTHYTSLVLVDTEGEVQEDLPVTRKVKLPTARTHADYGASVMHSPMVPGVMYAAAPEMQSFAPPSARRFSPPVSNRVHPGGHHLGDISELIDWDTQAPELAQGLLPSVHPLVHLTMGQLLYDSRIRDFAGAYDLDPQHLAIALLAQLVAKESRQARRVVRRLIGSADRSAFEQLANKLAFEWITYASIHDPFDW